MRDSLLRLIGIAVLLSLSVGGIGCTSDDSETSSDGAIEHPIEARIPQHDRAVPITRQQPLSDLPDPPRELRTLSLFLDEPTKIDTTRLDVLLKGSSSVDVASVSSDRFVLLVGHPENRLYEHDLRTGTTTQIAKPGSGPGRLQFAEAVAHSDTAVYVTRQDRRIDRFDCTTVPCTYDESIRLQFGPMALTATDDRLATVGIPVMEGEGMTMDDWSGAIQILGSDGSIEQTFGRTYQTEHYLMLDNYTRNSSLIYIGSQNEFVLARENLPLLWTYGKNGSPESVWTIEDYAPLTIKYFPSERKTHKEFEDDYSTLRLQDVIAGRFAVATVSRTNFSPSSSDLFLAHIDYDALDSKTDETYYLGRDAPRDEIIDRLFLVTDEHQVLVEDGGVAVVTGTQSSRRTNRRESRTREASKKR